MDKKEIISKSTLSRFFISWSVLQHAKFHAKFWVKKG
jgi:hypothetical protein